MVDMRPGSNAARQARQGLISAHIKRRADTERCAKAEKARLGVGGLIAPWRQQKEENYRRTVQWAMYLA